jgi:hypothetical protein
VSSAPASRSLPQQPSARWNAYSPGRRPGSPSPGVTPSPWSVPFGSPPAAPRGGRSRGFCSSPVQEYRGPLRLLARRPRRLRLLAYTPRYPTPSGAGPYETSRGNACSFPTVPTAHTLMHPGTPSISFAAIVPARSRLDFGRPVRLVRLRPGGLPQTLRTPPHGGRPVLRPWRRGQRVARGVTQRRPVDGGRSSRPFPAPAPMSRHPGSSFVAPPLVSPITSHAQRGITPAFGYGPRLENGPAGLPPARNMRRPARTTGGTSTAVTWPPRSDGSKRSWRPG